MKINVGPDILEFQYKSKLDGLNAWLQSAHQIHYMRIPFPGPNTKQSAKSPPPLVNLLGVHTLYTQKQQADK